MATGTGLDSQLGGKLESAYNTPVTVDKFWEFDSESLQWVPNWIEPGGLRVGVKFKRGSRLRKSREGVTGQVTLEHSTRLMGLWWKLCLGSAVTTPTAAGAGFKQIHQPGDYLGKSATIQAGKPEPGSTVRAHTFAGCKIISWELAVSDNDKCRLTMDFDAASESTATALASASYVAAAEVFSFADCNLVNLGGTASTASGEVSIAGGAALTTIATGLSLKGNTPMATERYGLGNAGIKAQPLENDTPVITGSLTAEYNRTELYDAFKATTKQPMRIRFEGSVIGAGPEKNTLDIVIAQQIVKSAQPSVDGPGVVMAPIEFEVYSDEVNAAFQVKLISSDSAAL
jgi:hypothetical protein